MKHSNLTEKAINLLIGNNKILSNQFRHSVIKEENDEVGYFAYLSVNKSMVPAYTDEIHFGNVVGKTKDGEVVVAFVLYMKDGYLDCLEGFTFGNKKWPESDENLSLEVFDNN